MGNIIEMSTINKYYTYAYIDATNNEMIYIGKGSNNQIDDHIVDYKFFKYCNVEGTLHHKLNQLLSNKVEILKVKLHVGLTQQEALLLESLLISKIGTVKEGTGTLCNSRAGLYHKSAQLFCPICYKGGDTSRFSVELVRKYFHVCCNSHNHFDNNGNLIVNSYNVTPCHKSHTGYILSKCESVEEFFIRRQFHGFTLGHVVGATPDDYYCSLGTDNSVKSNRTHHNPYEPWYDWCSDDLLDYSLRGLDAIKV